MADPLFALTLQRPWAWAIARSTKRVENRSWAPPAELVGKLFAIHAGNTFDLSAVAGIRARGIDCPETASDHPTGIVALARIERVIHCDRESVPEEQTEWTIGPIAWLLRDVIALPEPVSCGGRLGIWRVTDGLLDRVRHQYELAREARTGAPR